MTLIWMRKDILDTICVAQLYVKYMRGWQAGGETTPKGFTTYTFADEYCIWLTSRTSNEYVQVAWKALIHDMNVSW